MKATNMRLMIADDEPKVVELIRALGHWEELGIEIINECYTGSKALSTLIEYKPDIALLDIMMPGMDGIQVIENAKAQGLSTVFIILSGYRHFEYAKSAIQLGVIDYLLKPLDEAQLNDTLKKACDYRKRILKQDAMVISLQQIENEKREQALHKYWKYALSGLDELPVQAPSNEEIHFTGFPFGQPLIMGVAIRSNVDNLLTRSGSIFEEKIMQFIQQMLDGAYPHMYHINTSGLYIQIAIGDESQVPQICRFLNQLYDRIYQLYDFYGQFEYRIGYFITNKHLLGMPEAFLNAQVALLDIPPHVHYARYRNEVYPQKTREDYLSEKEMVVYKRGLANLEEETIHWVFNLIRERIVKERNADTKQIFCLLNSMLHLIRNDTNTASLDVGSLLPTSGYTLLGLLSTVENTIVSQINLSRQNANSKTAGIIRRSEAYIHQNYYRAISLEDVAAYVGLSPNYLSMLFKQEKQVGFLQYLTEVRIEAAKELLVKSREPCRSIAKSIGYMDEKHFLKLFKKQVGLSPNEYRKLFQ